MPTIVDTFLLAAFALFPFIGSIYALRNWREAVLDLNATVESDQSSLLHLIIAQGNLNSQRSAALAQMALVISAIVLFTIPIDANAPVNISGVISFVAVMISSILLSYMSYTGNAYRENVKRFREKNK